MTRSLALATLVAAAAATVPAQGATRRVPETRTVCAQSTYVEHAPADHPRGVAYRHDHFRVERYVHTAHKGIWAQGRHVERVRTSGWIRVSALCPGG